MLVSVLPPAGHEQDREWVLVLNYMNKFVIIGIAVAFIAGITITVVVMMNAQTDREQQIESRMRAEQKLQALKSSKQQKLAAQAARAEAERQVREQRAAAALAEASKPHYDPGRLRQAAKIKQFANVTIPDFNIECWLKTNWKDGKVNFRLAMLGQREALTQFQGSWPEYLITWTDAAGTNLHSIIVPSSSLHWAPLGTNNGIPTLELDSSDDCALEIYERSSNWNFNWQI